MEDKKLRQKLSNAVTKAGLSWLAYSAIVEIADEIEGFPVTTAVWYYDSLLNKEKIAISTRFMKMLTVNELALIIMHEMLHKAMYRNIPFATNKRLINFALDATINKILFMSRPKGMLRLAKKVFTDERLTIQSIVDCSITSEERGMLPPYMKKIFDEIYYSDKLRCTSCECLSEKYYQNTSVPDPFDLYMTLSIKLRKEDKKQIEDEYLCVFDNNDGNDDSESDEDSDNSCDLEKDDGQSEDLEEEKSENKTSHNKSKRTKHIRGGPEGKRENTKTAIEQEKDIGELVAEKISKGNRYSHTVNIMETFDRYILQAEECETKGLKDFIETWNTQKQIEAVEQNIYDTIVINPRFDPFPMNLTRTGYELMVLGISSLDEIPLFINISQSVCAKKKVACYFDVSPSIQEAIPFMIHVADFLSDLPEIEMAGGEYSGRFKFAGNVDGIPRDEWEDFKRGNVLSGWSTSFESVLRHALDDLDGEDVDIIAIFTDGESNALEGTLDEFANSGKICYRVYFKGSHSYREPASNLDELPGESFTIDLPTPKNKRSGYY